MIQPISEKRFVPIKDSLDIFNLTTRHSELLKELGDCLVTTASLFSDYNSPKSLVKLLNTTATAFLSEKDSTNQTERLVIACFFKGNSDLEVTKGPYVSVFLLNNEIELVERFNNDPSTINGFVEDIISIHDDQIADLDFLFKSLLVTFVPNY